MPSKPTDTLALVAGRIGRAADRRRIAVVHVHGVIGGSVRPRETVERLDALRRSPRIRAVLLDIDSPGGGATGSEHLYRAVRRLAADKPVVAWVRGTGASGAYFLACGATRMLAFPGAVIGSIGVISAHPVIVDALRRLGASVNVTKTGPFKDLGAPWREPTEDERTKERELVDAVFRRFRGAVADARHLEGDALDRVVTGEVWLADDALGLGLLDGVCDEEEALEEAQRLAGLPHHRTLRVRPRRTILQRAGLPVLAPGASLTRWLAEVEGWMGVPEVRL